MVQVQILIGGVFILIGQTGSTWCVGTTAGNNAAGLHADTNTNQQLGMMLTMQIFTLLPTLIQLEL